MHYKEDSMSISTTNPTTIEVSSFIKDQETLLKRFVKFVDASPETIKTYKKSLKNFFVYLNKNNITNPQREDIISYRDTIKSYLQPNSVQLYMVAVRLFFSWLNQEGLYPNVAFKIKGAHVGNGHKRHYLTVPQIQMVLNSFTRATIKEKRDYAILLLMIIGGLRVIEVSRANISDLKVLGEDVVLYVHGKGEDDKNSFILIPPQLDDALRDYLKERDAPTSFSPLFCSTSNNSLGNRLSTRSISGLVKSRLVAAGYDSQFLTAHSLRHSAGTISMLKGGTLEETQQFLRHSNINTTMTYLHHLNRLHNKSEERITNAIFQK